MQTTIQEGVLTLKVPNHEITTNLGTNFDNEINIQDIVLLLNFVLESDLPTNTEFFVSDINADNLLNILDVVQVVNIILSNF